MSPEENQNKTEESKAPEKVPEAGGEIAPLKGLLGQKVGMTRIFVDESRMIPVSVVQSEGAVVTQVKTREKDGYAAVQVGFIDVPEKKLNKPLIGHLTKKNLPLRRYLHEFRVNDSAPFKVGQKVPVSVFAKGDWVQVSGTAKGKGFAGVVKRYGFSGLPHSHGHGEYRNRPGTSGAQGPQHVLPGTRKPGHKGHFWLTLPKVSVVDVDSEKNLILLKGSIPGPNGSYVVIRQTSKKIRVVNTPVSADKKKAKK